MAATPTSAEADADPAGRSPSMAALAARPVESATSWIERWGALDRLGEVVASIGGVVRPGLIKDVLSGTWLGHPAHPLLTDIPIGAWTSSFILDVFGGEKTKPGADALVGVGILASLPTAITGISDLADTEDKEPRRVGVVHAAANVAGLGLYTLSYLSRKAGNRRAGVTLSSLGAVAMTVGGLLGGHLSYRKGIGVNQTAFDRRPRRWTAVLDSGELRAGVPAKATVAGADVMLLRQEGGVFAVANRCSHRGGPLDKGTVGDGPTVTCPWHLSTFDVTDGAVLRGPASAPQPVYEVREHEGKIEVRAKS
jgi:nitrite reductase/ring-hydroxylating ferredoxin subunit/uncharacterized membrane protein